MKIQIETGSYNERRYGKPWIATVDFSTAKGAPNLVAHYCPAYDDDMPQDAAEFILEQMGFEWDITEVNERPDGLMNDAATHYKVDIERNNNSLTIYFSAGSHAGYPELSQVIASLLMDFSYLELDTDKDAPAILNSIVCEPGSPEEAAFIEWMEMTGSDYPLMSLRAFISSAIHAREFSKLASKDETEQLQEILSEC